MGLSLASRVAQEMAIPAASSRISIGLEKRDLRALTEKSGIFPYKAPTSMVDLNSVVGCAVPTEAFSTFLERYVLLQLPVSRSHVCIVWRYYSLRMWIQYMIATSSRAMQYAPSAVICHSVVSCHSVPHQLIGAPQTRQQFHGLAFLVSLIRV